MDAIGYNPTMANMTEYEEAVALANKLLDEPNADPDDDLRMLSRQFLRAVEARRLITKAAWKTIEMGRCHGYGSTTHYEATGELCQLIGWKVGKKPPADIPIRPSLQDPNRPFPIQQSSPIPWVLAQRAYDTYAKLFGTSQSLERLAERGGFGLQEFACLFNDHDPRACQDQQACRMSSDHTGRLLLSLQKAVTELKAELAKRDDPGLDLIHSNRDEILRKHEDAVRRVRKLLTAPGHEADRLRDIGSVLDALSKFHPMHADSWPVWPEGS